MTHLTLAVLGLLLTAALAGAPPIQEQPLPWAGFKPGSWVKVTQHKPHEMSIPVTQTLTLQKVVDEKWLLVHVDPVIEEDFPDTESVPIDPLRDTLASLKRRDEPEELDVLGRKVACEVWAQEDKDNNSYRCWIRKDLGMNQGVVQEEWWCDGTSRKKRLIRAGEKVKVGRKEVECWVTRLTISDPKDPKWGWVFTEWKSLQVPGWKVRERRCKIGEDPEKDGELLIEAVDFETKS